MFLGNIAVGVIASSNQTIQAKGLSFIPRSRFRAIWRYSCSTMNEFSLIRGTITPFLYSESEHFTTTLSPILAIKRRNRRAFCQSFIVTMLSVTPYQLFPFCISQSSPPTCSIYPILSDCIILFIPLNSDESPPQTLSSHPG